MLYCEKYKEKEIKRKAFSSLVCCQFALHSLSWHFVLITRPLIYNHVRKKRSKREAFSSLVCLAFPLLAFCSDHSCFQQITGQLRTNCAPTLVITEPIFIFFCSHQLIVCHFSFRNQSTTRQLRFLLPGNYAAPTLVISEPIFLVFLF